jgi:hypothetical protein
MLPLQFFGQNIHFAIDLFAALVFFAVFWLYFDAWLAQEQKQKKDFLKWAGFLMVAISFAAQATALEQTSPLTHTTSSSTAQAAAVVLRLTGYLLIILGLLIEPLQPKPQIEPLEKQFRPKVRPKKTRKKNLASLIFSPSGNLTFGLPLGALFICLLYLRRATVGLERHLKLIAIAFASLFGFELLSLCALARNTTNPTVENLAKAFGPAWIAAHVLLLASAILLGVWVWKYLLERFISQLFMIFTSVILFIFLITTVSFTFLLTRNIQNDTLSNLNTAAGVLNYALDAKKAETKANAEALATNPLLVQALLARDHKALLMLTDDFLANKKQSSMLITSNSAQVLLRAEDPERWGDSLSSDTQVRRAVIGSASSSITTKEGVLSPLVYIKSTAPIEDSNKNIVGTVSVGLVIDNAFVDGIKHATGLDSAIYSNNIRSATTFLVPDGKSRWVGVAENSKQIKQNVLINGKTFKGPISVLNRSYLAVYAPLKDVDNNIVGMIFIGKSQAEVLQTANHSIELTFLVTAVLMVLSIWPSYIVARHIARQLQ